jgi:putative tryptophan/tyrosine transport system substrate-binding protein
VKSAIAASNTVPVVMIATEFDPLARRYVKSLARPGGRVTGVFLQQIELASKRLQLLKDALPTFEAATMFWDAPSEYQWKAASRPPALVGRADGRDHSYPTPEFGPMIAPFAKCGRGWLCRGGERLPGRRKQHTLIRGA